MKEAYEIGNNWNKDVNFTYTDINIFDKEFDKEIANFMRRKTYGNKNDNEKDKEFLRRKSL